MLSNDSSTVPASVRPLLGSALVSEGLTAHRAERSIVAVSPGQPRRRRRRRLRTRGRRLLEQPADGETWGGALGWQKVGSWEDGATAPHAGALVRKGGDEARTVGRGSGRGGALLRGSKPEAGVGGGLFEGGVGEESGGGKLGGGNGGRGAGVDFTSSSEGEIGQGAGLSGLGASHDRGRPAEADAAAEPATERASAVGGRAEAGFAGSAAVSGRTGAMADASTVGADAHGVGGRSRSKRHSRSSRTAMKVRSIDKKKLVRSALFGMIAPCRTHGFLLP